MLRIFKRKTKIESSPQATCATGADFARLLNEHLEHIAKVCERATGGEGQAPFKHAPAIVGEGGHSYRVDHPGTLDSDELFVQVLDHLKEDDFRRLRGFEGRSSFATYLNSIISRLVVDLVRQRSGRSRAKERAGKLGELGERVYDLMVARGHSASESALIMETSFGLQVSVDELHAVHRSLLGRDTRHQASVESETAWGEDGELVAIQAVTPEDAYVAKARQELRSALLTDLINSLDGNDRLLLRLRFPLDEAAEPLEMSVIAAMVGLGEEQAERRLRRILVNCRKELLGKGLNLDDLL